MKTLVPLALALGALVAITASAQPGGTPPAGEKTETKDSAPKGFIGKGTAKSTDDKAKDEADTKKPEAAPKKRTGDIVTFKTGRVLSSVQVVRETLTDVEIRVMAGAAPLKIPRDQVEKIEYDNIDPNRPGQSALPASQGVPGVMTAQELSPELGRKLAVPLALEDLGLEGKPIIESLLSLSAKAGVSLEIAEPVRALKQDTLVWKNNPPAGTTFSSLLQDHIVRDYPELAVVYSFDQIVLTTKAAAQAAMPPPGAPVPGGPIPGAPVPGGLPGATPAVPPGALPPAPAPGAPSV